MPAKSKEEKKITTVRLGVELLNKLRKQAESEGRSLNNFIERKLKEV